MKHLGLYSSKFEFIINEIIESYARKEGPIVIYCEWVWFGILVLSKTLQRLGWDLVKLGDSTSIKKKPRFGIWSTESLEYMGIPTNNQELYTTNLQKIINSKENSNGELCKVVLITVTEGISFKNVSQVHIINPWWNESRMEQIIGRGIRFLSHVNLPEEKQHVAVFYHCSVLDTFDKYPNVNKIVNDAIKKVQMNHKKIDIESKVDENDNYAFSYRNYKDFARLTIEQKVYITARRKNNINSQFEIALKGTSVDLELNEYGNLIRLEEMNNPALKVIKNTKIMYNRSQNKYYSYDSITKNLSNMEMFFVNNEEHQKPVWPSMYYDIKNPVNLENEWKQHSIDTIINEKGEEMVSIIVTENIESFNNNEHVRDKNFQDLMKYAISKGEEKKVWDYFEIQRIKTKLFDLLVSTYNLSTGQGMNDLYETFTHTILKKQGNRAELRDKIINGTATKELTIGFLNEVNKKAYLKSAVNVNELKSIIKNMHVKRPLKKYKIKSIENRLKNLFITSNGNDMDKIRNILLDKFGINPELVEKSTDIDLYQIFNECTIRERNKKKE